MLRSLHLADRTVDSKCELWDASHIEAVTGLDRDALIAIAFLKGSDYDMRGNKAGHGVKAVGVKNAIKTAIGLRRFSQGQTLTALAALVRGKQVDDLVAPQVATQKGGCKGCKRCGHGDVKKHRCGKRGCLQCGTSEGCLPRLSEGYECECSYCAQVRAVGGIRRLESARSLARTASNASKDPSSSQGADAVVSQYKRHVQLRCPPEGGFQWRSVHVENLKLLFSGVYRAETIERKIQPLLFEVCLRRMVVECSKHTLLSLNQRRAWAVSKKFEYCPVSAKTTTTGGMSSLYALVTWAVASDETSTPLVLPPSARRVRLSLARECCLLDEDCVRPCVLSAAWKRLLANCPEGVRKNEESLFVWGRQNNLDLVPVRAVPVGKSKAKVYWRRIVGDRLDTDHIIIVPVGEVDTFGLCKIDKESTRKGQKRSSKSIGCNLNGSSDTAAPLTPPAQSSSCLSRTPQKRIEEA